MNKILSSLSDQRKDIIAVISISVVLLLFLLGTGTITSGFHFTDDHEIIRMKSDLSTSPLTEVIKKWIDEDINSTGRFRPVYYLLRVVKTYLFGSNFLLWSLNLALLSCATMSLFYLGIRNLSFSLRQSLIFLMIIFIGPQSAVLWRLGPSEILGMFFLSISFYAISRCINHKNHLLNSSLFIIGLLLASFSKESFIIIIPGMIFFKIWIEHRILWKSILITLVKNLLMLLPIISIAVEIFFIKKSVGTFNSGISSDLSNVFSGMLNSGIYFIRKYLILSVLIFFSLLHLLSRLKRVKISDIFPYAFFLIIWLPNLVLYLNSGLVERYLLPSTVGLAFLTVYIIKDIIEPHWSKKYFDIIVIISFVPFFKGCFIDAHNFSVEGRETNKLLSTVSANYSANDDVLLIAEPAYYYESSVSLKYYLKIVNDIDLFGFCLPKKEDTPEYKSLTEGWNSYFKGKLYENMTNGPEMILFLDKELVDQFFEKSGLKKEDFSEVEKLKGTRYAIFSTINRLAD